MQKVCDVGRYLTVILVDCFADMRYYLTGKVAFNVITIMRLSPNCAKDQIPWILLILQVQFYIHSVFIYVEVLCLYLCINPN